MPRSAIASVTSITDRLGPPSLEAIDRDHAAMHAEMDQALVRLHATFDQIAVDLDEEFARARRQLHQALRLPGAASWRRRFLPGWAGYQVRRAAARTGQHADLAAGAILLLTLGALILGGR
jgi:hypothetical protein